MPTSSKPASRFRRFVNWFLDLAACSDTVSRLIWAILTFGYAYPRRRVGENFTYCLVRHVVIFFSRLFCIMGAIYYIYRWMKYAAAGDQRELNTLRRETQAPEGGTLMPWFAVLSTDMNVTAIHYTNTTNTYYLKQSIANLTELEDMGAGWQRTSVLINHNLTNENQEYFEVVLQHATTLPAYPWYRLNFFSPKFMLETSVKNSPSGTRKYTVQDQFNEYFYQPGHYVELRYTPIEVHDQAKMGDTSNLFTKLKIFAGFGDEDITYSYETTVSFKPFPAEVMAAQNYTADTTVIIIRPQSSLQFIYYREEKTNFRDTMSSIGGLLSLAGSVIAFLFGAGLLSPWGKLVEMPYFRRKVAGSLAKAYDSKDGISKGPFTGRIENIGKFDPDMASHEVRITLLKERMDELELVLTEYYLEGDIFQDYASERLHFKQAKHEALVRAASTRNGDVGGLGSEQDIPLLPSQKMEAYRRQSISGNNSHQPSFPLGHSRKFSDSAYSPQRQPLSPPLPVPQSRSSYYGTKPPVAGTRPSTHHKSSSEQSLLRQSDSYSPGRASDETVNNNHHHYNTHTNESSMVSLLNQHGQPMYQASPMSPTYYPPQQQQQQQQQQQARYSMSSSSSAPPSPGHSRPKEEVSQFSVIHEVSGEIPVATTDNGSTGAAGAGVRDDAWWRSTTEASLNHGENNRVATTGQSNGGQGLGLDISNMPREP
ncbi:hypothetical protein MVEG_10747 [Podila verticillata NRRL 6337]|nr:hypothetical protein MVEG_10747 [Podila verticillata NRRL 6337]